MCGPCAKGDKTCYGLDSHPCGQCMRDKKMCKEVAVEHKCCLYTWVTWVFDTDVADKVSAPPKCGGLVKLKQAVKLKPAPKVAKPSSLQCLRPVQSKPIIVDSLPAMPQGSSQEKAELVVGVKWKVTEGAPNPRLAKCPFIEASTPQVEELDQLAALLNGTWDEVVEAREAVGTAEGHLRAVEGRFQVMDDWVRALCHQPREEERLIL